MSKPQKNVGRVSPKGCENPCGATRQATSAHDDVGLREETANPTYVGMAGDWIPSTLADVSSDVSYGYTESATSDKVGPRFLRITDIQNGVVAWGNVPYCPISEANHRKYRLDQGDIVVARTGNSTGENFLYRGNEDAVFASYLIRFRVDRQKAEPAFVWYNLRSVKWWDFINNSKIGSAQAGANAKILGQFPIRLPLLTEQKAIAHILGTLDDKIELNRRMNATLEAMARALFQSWFVDFDPVRAKLDGRQPASLDAATAALFPAHFQESSLGHIPQGWEVRSLDQVADYLNGLALQKYPPGDGETLPVIKIAQLRKGDSEGADRCNTDLASQYVVEDGDVLFSWSGSLEVELWCGGRGALNQHLFKVTSSDFPKWFYYLWTLYHLDEFRLIAADKATTMGHIQRGHLTAAKVLVPPPVLLESMTRIMAPLIDQIIANRAQSRTLATLRNALLPMLLSGDIRVPNVENEVASV
ncbi:MAG: restriction endonuclease subunit S [Sideroxyarcus sp.]|nr:restriction endonuclease subunit S [Sideroxyarcus sp.]